VTHGTRLTTGAVRDYGAPVVAPEKAVVDATWKEGGAEHEEGGDRPGDRDPRPGGIDPI